MINDMSYTTKLVLTFVLSGVIVSAAIYLYGAYGPFYRTEPLILPLSFSSNSVHQAEFASPRADEESSGPDLAILCG